MPTATMIYQATIKQLNELCQLDADAIELYARALEHIDDAPVREDLARFKADHERHVDELTRIVRELRGTPVARTRDLKGVVREVFTALRSVTGTRGALKAMRMNEKLTNRGYDAALDSDLPPNVYAVVVQHFADERRHLAAISDHLARLSSGDGGRPGPVTTEPPDDHDDRAVVIQVIDDCPTARL